jgi:hypothetical protein
MDATWAQHEDEMRESETIIQEQHEPNQTQITWTSFKPLEILLSVTFPKLVDSIRNQISFSVKLL